ncbi:hypothetical protein K439DRAFT_1612799 [Ramaria rubella]|nr:hypothetical protein K439DRAFT_1612799 [Ramaria rubella]
MSEPNVGVAGVVNRGRDVGPKHKLEKSPSANFCTVGAGNGFIATSLDKSPKVLRIGNTRVSQCNPQPFMLLAPQSLTQMSFSDISRVRFLTDISLWTFATRRGAMQFIADALSLSLMDAAEEDTLRIMDHESRLDALQIFSVETEHDPRDSALVVFGGAGPVHGKFIACSR